ncbi:MAG: RIP metalloprotease RseP [Deltaproteobacteria bacterium]|nr:MAG: RIP metalloprotease RseP [Deltaproteobacteria bacterium]
MTALSYLWAFVLLLSILVFVHELGHFAVARACGVRVLKFSIGFGPPIGFGRYRLAWRRRGTDYVIAWFPLGGFVKMLGENPDELDDPELAEYPGESLPEKKTWQKLAIVFAGPVANLILPVVVFVATLAVGMPRPTAVVGSVEPGSPAASAGLRPGDRIAAVAGERVTWWSDLEDAVRTRAGETVEIAYERGGAPVTARVAVARRMVADEFGKPVAVGSLGVEHHRPAAMLGVPSSDSPAHAAGLRSGDVVESVNGAKVESWDEFAAAYAAVPSGTVQLGLRRGATATAAPDAHRTVTIPALGSAEALGVLPATVLVDKVEPGSAAEQAGLQSGDLIVSVDGAPVGSFNSFAEIVRTSGGRPLALTFARNGELHAVSVAPKLQEFDAGFGVKEPRYLVGITAEVANLPGALATDRERNPLVSLPRAVAMTGEVTKSFLAGLVKIATGEVSRKQLQGPIGIAEIAGHAYERGWETYLSILVLISINLGILNLLPIPVLDGGQAVIYAVEGVQRAPLSLRTREIVQQLGLTVLLLLMGLAFWNDLSRQWVRLLDWLANT